MQSKLINIAGHVFTHCFGRDEDELNFLIKLESECADVEVCCKVADGPYGGYFDIKYADFHVGAISGFHLQAIQDTPKNGESNGMLR